MRNLTLRDKPPGPPQYELDDAKRIQDALFEMGLSATLEAIHEAWSQHSADYCAGWLDVGGHNGVIAAVDVLLHGDVGGGTLNGREDGPFLVEHGTNAEINVDRQS